MNKMKSLFIGMFPMFAMGVAGYGLYHLASSGLDLIWLGAVLITLPVMLFISRIMMFKNVARTTAHFPLLSLIAILGLGLSSYAYVEAISSPLGRVESTLSNSIGISLAVVGFIFFVLYNFWYSSLGRLENTQLELGNTLPKFTVTNAQGERIHSDTFAGSATVYIFFRGNWCPLCMAQIKEIAAQYRELSALGAKVVLCAPQPEKNTQALADKFDVPFIFVSDVANSAAKILGIEMKNGLPAGMEMLGYDKDTVYPTVIITDKNGKIIYSDLTNNYRIRPEPEAFIKVLQENTQLA
ncbi:MAG: redoxin domain-containing protein [Methyloprofundus sp.]|nr:redoxin domain-containing protein [Methyloprofundus sp.]